MTATAAPRPTIREHLDGCPAKRIERYESVRPADKRVMEVTRCMDCGNQDTKPTDRLATNLSQVEDQEGPADDA